MDVEALGRVLADPEIGAFSVQIRLNEPAHRSSLAIEDFFAERKAEDLALFYFSGHGLRDDEGELYFAMADTQRARLRSTAVGASFVQSVMNSSRASQSLLLLDCCYSGAFAIRAGSKSDAGVHLATRFQARGRVVLTASDSVRPAFESESSAGVGVRSQYTAVLVKGLEDGGADLNGDGDVDVDEMHTYLENELASASSLQRPCKFSWDVQGSLVVARNPMLVELPPSLKSKLLLGKGSPLSKTVVERLVQIRSSNADGGAVAADEALKLLATKIGPIAAEARLALSRITEEQELAKSQIRPFRFRGIGYLEPAELATALSREWKSAIDTIVRPAGERWANLKHWLRQFSDWPLHDQESVSQAFDEIDSSSNLTPEIKLISLLAALKPSLSARYRDFEITASRIRVLTAVAFMDENQPSPEALLVNEFWLNGALRYLARFDGHSELGSIDADWRDSVKNFESELAPSTLNRMTHVRADVRSMARIALLGDVCGSLLLADRAESMPLVLSTLPVRIPWFEEMVEARSEGRHQLLSAVLLAPAALAQSAAAKLQADKAQLAREVLGREWDGREVARIGGRSKAISVSVVSIIGVDLLFCASIWIPSTATAMIATLAVALFIQLFGEGLLAYKLGGNYYPRYAIITTARESLSRIGRYAPEAPKWSALGLVVLFFVLLSPSLSAVGFIGFSGLTVAWAVVRFFAWRKRFDPRP